MWPFKKSAIDQLIDEIEKKVVGEPQNWIYNPEGRNHYKYNSINPIYIRGNSPGNKKDMTTCIDTNTSQGGQINLSKSQLNRINYLYNSLKAYKGLINISQGVKSEENS